MPSQTQLRRHTKPTQTALEVAQAGRHLLLRRYRLPPVGRTYVVYGSHVVFKTFFVGQTSATLLALVRTSTFGRLRASGHVDFVHFHHVTSQVLLASVSARAHHALKLLPVETLHDFRAQNAMRSGLVAEEGLSGGEGACANLTYHRLLALRLERLLVLERQTVYLDQMSFQLVGEGVALSAEVAHVTSHGFRFFFTFLGRIRLQNREFSNLAVGCKSVVFQTLSAVEESWTVVTSELLRVFRLLLLDFSGRVLLEVVVL